MNAGPHQAGVAEHVAAATKGCPCPVSTRLCKLPRNWFQPALQNLETFEGGRQPDVFEVQPGLFAIVLRRQREYDARADPLVLVSQKRCIDERFNDVPTHLAVGHQAFDLHHLVGLVETEGGPAANGAGDLAGLRPPAAQTPLRGQGLVDRGRRCGKKELAVVVVHEEGSTGNKCNKLVACYFA